MKGSVFSTYPKTVGQQFFGLRMPVTLMFFSLSLTLSETGVFLSWLHRKFAQTFARRYLGYVYELCSLSIRL
jgi:hypothetical protein